MKRAIAGLAISLVLTDPVSAQARLTSVVEQPETVSVRDGTASLAAQQPANSTRGNLMVLPVAFSGRRPIAHALIAPAATVSLLKPVDKPSPSPWYAPFASLTVPGSGQALLKQQRSVAYLAAEVFLVLRAVRADHDKSAARAEYQRLAAEVARAGFGSDHPVGDWDYYEILEKFPASGAYNMAAAGKFTPESDTLTWNGRVWLRARQLFWDSPDNPPTESSPEYQRALDRYQKDALQGGFQFSWREQNGVRNEYILSVADANRSTQKVVSTLGFLAANHLASFVDAYITVRLRRFGGAGLVGASIKTELRPTGSYGDNAYGAAMTLSVPIGNSLRRR
ncbi:MAG: hypothetical protein ABI852_13125 [Gemmatimonadaceae bacterium]